MSLFKDACTERDLTVYIDFMKLRPVIKSKFRNYAELCSAIGSHNQNTINKLERANREGIMLHKPNWPDHYTISQRLFKVLKVNYKKFIASESKIKKWRETP